MGNKRVLWIDIAKGIAIALVIIGHTLATGSILRKLIFSFHMPVFFILAGVTFRVKPMRDVLSSSAKRLLVPYCLIFCARTILSWLLSGTIDAKSFGFSSLSFLFASGTVVEPWGIPAAGMIWFLFSLFCARVILNFASLQFQNRGISLYVQFIFWAVVCVAGICIGEPSKAMPFLAGIGKRQNGRVFSS